MHFYLYFVAVVLLLASLGMLAARWGVLRSGARATGCVVSHEKREREDGTSFHPVFTFTDASGDVHQVASNTGWSAPRPAVGTAVPVRYMPRDPRRAYIDSFYHLWFWPVALAAFGAVLLAGTVVAAAAPAPTVPTHIIQVTTKEDLALVEVLETSIAAVSGPVTACVNAGTAPSVCECRDVKTLKRLRQSALATLAKRPAWNADQTVVSWESKGKPGEPPIMGHSLVVARIESFADQTLLRCAKQP